MAKRPVEKYDFKAFGEAIKAARTGRKESRKQVSDEMYISPRYLANIENKGQHPSLQIFFELMLRYNISVDQFLLDTPVGKDTKRRQLDALLDRICRDRLGAEERLDHEAEVHTGDVDDPALLRLHKDDLLEDGTTVDVGEDDGLVLRAHRVNKGLDARGEIGVVHVAVNCLHHVRHAGQDSDRAPDSACEVAVRRDKNFLHRVSPRANSGWGSEAGSC